MKPSIVIVFLLISIPDFAQDWLQDKEDLKGKVKSVHYSAVSGDESFATYSASYYNPKGFLVRLTTGSDPEFVEHEVYRIYDETQTRCLIEYDQFSSDIDTSKKGMFVYTQDGKVGEEKFYDHGNLLNTSYYIYNSAGLLREHFFAFVGEKDTSRTIYEYDEFGRKIKEIEKSSSFGLVKSWKYGSEGKLLEEKSELLKAPKTIIFNMNVDGTVANKKEIDVNPDDNRNYVISYSYNETGQLIRESEKYLDGRTKEIKSFIYLENGNIDKVEYLKESGEKLDSHTAYEYDSQGNWIKEIVYWGDKAEMIRTRMIEYY